MNWIKGNTEWFKPLECVNTNEGIYYVNLAKVPFTEEDNDDINIRYINTRLTHLPSTQELKSLLLDLQEQYDSSEEVNGFTVGDKVMWLNKATRLGLINSLSIQKETGLTESIMWLGGTSVTVNIDTALAFLKALELYALECYNITQQHIGEIENLKTQEEIFNYDITSGYPARPSFQL